MLPDLEAKPFAGTFYRLTHLRAPDALVATGTDHRFDHDDEENPTSYLGDSIQTVLREIEGGLSTQVGFSVQIRPGTYRLISVRVDLTRVWDLRTPAVQAALGPLAELVSASGHPEELKMLGREARRAGIQGMLWASTKHPGGGCLVVFLENVPEGSISITDTQTLYERPE